MNWDDLRYLLAVARNGGLSEAARQLKVSPSTVSRHIERLEKNLQQPLFHHGYDGYRPNEHCLRLLSDAETIEMQIHSLQRAADTHPDGPRGIVRVSTPELQAHELIIPALPAFHAAYPRISLELAADVRPVRLTRREADVVVRVVRPSEGDYKIRKIGRVSAALFGAADYLRLHGKPRVPSDLADHSLISWDRDFDFLVMVGWLTDLVGEHRPWLRTTSYTAQYRACLAGLGLALLPSVSPSAPGYAASWPICRRWISMSGCSRVWHRPATNRSSGWPIFSLRYSQNESTTTRLAGTILKARGGLYQNDGLSLSL